MAELLLFALFLCCVLSLGSALVALWHMVADARAVRKMQHISDKYHNGVQVEKLTPEEAYRKAMK